MTPTKDQLTAFMTDLGLLTWYEGSEVFWYYSNPENTVGLFPNQAVLLYQIVKQREAEIKRAFGDCTNCYGKGYASYDTATIGYPDFVGDEGFKKYEHRMVFCKCERGKQLEQFVSRLQSTNNEDE